jgi:hypothetical protein
MSTFIKQNDKMLPYREVTGRAVNPMKVNGVLLLTIDGTPIFTKEMHDFVDQLWAFLIQSVDQLNTKRESDFYFPDQGIHVVLTRLSQRNLLRIHVVELKEVSALVDFDLFRDAVKVEGTGFMTFMKKHSPWHVVAFDQELSRMARWK